VTGTVIFFKARVARSGKASGESYRAKKTCPLSLPRLEISTVVAVAKVENIIRDARARNFMVKSSGASRINQV
jgi:hypothetical protein